MIHKSVLSGSHYSDNGQVQGLDWMVFHYFFLLLELLELFILLPYLLLLQNNDSCERSKRFVLSKVPLVYFNVLYKHVGVCRKIALYLYKLCSKKSFLNVVNEKKKQKHV